MQITRDTLPQIDHITLSLEGGEDFVIDGKSIIDIWFDEIQVGATIYGHDIAHDGRLVLSKDTFKVLSSFADNEYNDEDKDDVSQSFYFPEEAILESVHCPEEEYYFYNRITKWCDISAVYVYFKNGERVWFCVDYDPLENELLDYAVEYSNCASAELNEDGDMIILFGKSSHAFKRVDNDYYNVIEGLNEFLPQKIKETLIVKVENFENAGEYCCSPQGGLFIDLCIKNKAYKNKYLPLKFFNISELLFNLDFKYNDKERLLISPTISGKLLVQIGCICNFYCGKIEVA